MEMTMRLPSLLAVAGIAFLPAFAGAQPAPPAAPAGTRIFVTPGAGSPVLEGSLLSLSADSVALLVDGNTRILPLASVKRVEREGDPTSDGVQKGALVLGLLCMLTCGQGVNSGNELAGVVVGNMVIGGLIGWQADRGHVGRSRIYPLKRD
jgi:hypothetical protein